MLALAQRIIAKDSGAGISFAFLLTVLVVLAIIALVVLIVRRRH